MKRTLCLILVATLLLTTNVFAASDDTADICDEVITATNEYCVSVETSGIQTRVNWLTSGAKVQELCNEAGDVLIIFKVFGTFKYNSTTAIATQASYDYEIVSGSWYLVSASAYCQGDTAIAEAEFKHPLLGTVYSTVTLTCSPTGYLT